MKFENIFKEEGLYVADTFQKGVAMRIQKNIITDDRELTIIEISEETGRFKNVIDIPVYEGMFKKDYRKIDNVKELFQDNKK